MLVFFSVKIVFVLGVKLGVSTLNMFWERDIKTQTDRIQRKIRALKKRSFLKIKMRLRDS